METTDNQSFGRPETPPNKAKLAQSLQILPSAAKGGTSEPCRAAAARRNARFPCFEMIVSIGAYGFGRVILADDKSNNYDLLIFFPAVRAPKLPVHPPSCPPSPFEPQPPLESSHSKQASKRPSVVHWFYPLLLLLVLLLSSSSSLFAWSP